MTSSSKTEKSDEIERLAWDVLERSERLMPLKAFAEFADALLFIEALARLREAIALARMSRR